MEGRSNLGSGCYGEGCECVVLPVEQNLGAMAPLLPPEASVHLFESQTLHL